MNTSNNYELLISRLDQFIRKYYVNALIRGSLYSVALIVAIFLAFSLLENFFFFGTGVRKTMFWAFVGISGGALAFWFLAPLLHYFRLGRIISHEQAAAIIGNHFTDVKDKLLNILQLRHQSDHAASKELILASIEQKSGEIRPVPFKAAIDLTRNRKYLRYAIPPTLILIFLLFSAPSLIYNSTFRLINNNKAFEKPAPFSFVIQNKDMKVVQFGDYMLSVKTAGTVLPNEVFIDINGYQYRLQKVAADLFTYQFTNVQKETAFRLFSGPVTSLDYQLEVLKKPNIAGFEVDLTFPAYLGRPRETLQNSGDLVVPAGTQIHWAFHTAHTDQISIRFGNTGRSEALKRSGTNLFQYNRKVMSDDTYKLFISNQVLPDADSVLYSLTVVPDLYPTINVEKFEDSTDQSLLFFAGDASDDYGLRSLTFQYRIKKANGAQGPLVTSRLPQPTGKQIQYNYTWSIADLGLQPGDEVTYYFEVLDNDGVNGSKAARTHLMVFAMPTVKELEQMAAKNNQDIKEQLKESLKESKKIQQDLQKMREKVLQQKEMDWQTRKEMEKLLQRQQELEKQMQDAKEKFDENIRNQEKISPIDEKIRQKQEQVQELFEELMSEEMKELMKQIEELLQQLEKNDALEMMDEMKMNDEELEKELDRMMELFKQLELEHEMQQTLDQLEKLAEEQEKLAQETEKEKQSSEQLKKEQDHINQQFDEIQEKMDELEKKNESLENPMDIDQQEELQQEIDKDLQDSKENIEKKQNSKASKSQKSAAQKMRDMAGQMKNAMESGEQEQMEEDMQALRQLLENLVNLSFDQEDLIAEFNKTQENTQRYVKLVQEQYRLKDNFQLIEDSLQALSKRVYQIESFVTEKVTEVKYNMKGSLEELEERHKNQAAVLQQNTMKNVNDLALMLSEVMDQMQQAMSSMMSGNQNCQKPGNKPGGKGKGNSPKDKMSQGQKGITEDMKKMAEQLKKGGKGMSKQFAEMAARQAALRNALREKQKELQQQGKGSKELQDIQDLMDKVETELVNKQLNNETIRRVQEIETRLLEHEKAEQQRELDEQRKAETAREYERQMPPSLQEYIKKREAEIEMFRTVNPSLKPYYKQLVEEYFKSLKAK